MLGVLEIFFGPPWTMEERGDWADFLAAHGFDFYIYGPKADACLRKHWREAWPPEYLTLMGVLAGEYRMRGLRFGVALSPFGVAHPVDSSIKRDLCQKVEELSGAGVEIFGLFFDDMKCTDQLADMQLELLQETQKATTSHILFCPSYYSTDPILDKVFGARPEGYLERLGREIPQDVDILWTGPKMISPEIGVQHLQTVTELLGRKPFLCDNIFANDGPKNCKFLKLRNFLRQPEEFQAAAGWSLNPMNQSALSQVVVLSAAKVFRAGLSPEPALSQALHELCPTQLADWILARQDRFLNQGLDQISAVDKEGMIKELEVWPHPVAREIQRWLRGEFIVGNECLTD